MEQAACRGMAPAYPGEPDPFFPERGQALVGNQALITCFKCPVRVECDDYKKRTNTEFGIWAGKYSKRGGEDEDGDGDAADG